MGFKVGLFGQKKRENLGFLLKDFICGVRVYDNFAWKWFYATLVNERNFFPLVYK